MIVYLVERSYEITKCNPSDLSEMIKMPRFERAHRNLLFRSNNYCDSSFDSWGGVLAHVAVDAFKGCREL